MRPPPLDFKITVEESVYKYKELDACSLPDLPKDAWGLRKWRLAIHNSLDKLDLTGHAGFHACRKDGMISYA